MAGVSSSKNAPSYSKIGYPFEFLSGFENLFGAAPRGEDVLRYLPQTPNLFGAPPAQPPPTQPPPTTPPPGVPSTPHGPHGEPPGGYTLPDQPTGTAQSIRSAPPKPEYKPLPPGETTSPSNQPMITYGEILPLASGGFANPKDAARIQAAVGSELAKQGYTIDGPIPQDVLIRAIQKAGEGDNFATGALPGLITQYTQMRDRTTGVGEAVKETLGSAPQVGVDVQGGLANLGFGQAPQQLEAPNISGGVPTVQAQDATAANINIAPEGFKKYAQDLFESQYRPVEREILQRSRLDERKLQSQLANSGLASSGVAFGTMGEFRNERDRQLVAAAQDASSNAAVQAFGAEFQQARENAAFQQQTALQNAGLNLDAQKTNAGNILQGRTADAEAYIKTMGLNIEQVDRARDDFLSVLDLQQKELERLDQAGLRRLETAFNIWLQEFSAITKAGPVSAGGGGSSSSVNIL